MRRRRALLLAVVAVLVAVAGLGYLADTFGAVLVPGYALTVSNVTFVGEVTLMLWLLIPRRTITSGPAPTAEAPLVPAR